MDVQQQEFEVEDHDTVDVAEEIDEIDALLAEDTVPVPGPGRRVGVVELVLLTLANAIWAIVGLVLWLPQALRAVLGAALRVIHSALTNQRSDRAVTGIKIVSGLYFDRFLRRRGEPTLVARRHELRPFRLVGEILWIVGFYLLVLRWLAPSTFEPIWERLVSWWNVGAGESASVAGGLLEFATSLPGLVPEGRWLWIGAALGMGALGLLLGHWLGRRKG